MKKSDVQIGSTYLVKVAGNLVPVKITREHDNGGWEGTSVKTGKTIRIKSPQRLRKPLDDGAAKEPKRRKKKLTPAERKTLSAEHPRKQADQENARLRDEREASPDGMTASERAMSHSEPKRKRTGPTLLEAAIQVLEEHGEPMTCSQMIEKIFEKKLWSTTGKTPAQTLYSAILRELQKRGDDPKKPSRFVHVERGKFKMRG